MRPSLIPVGPGVPPTVAPVLKSHEDAIRQIQQPGSPTQFALLAFSELPPAADWPNSAILVTDKGCLAISVAQGASYAWLRADGSAL